MLDESKLRKVALITIPVVGVFACAFFAALTFLALQAREVIASGATGLGGTVTRANATVDTLNATLAHINRPCKGAAGPDACGTLAQVNKSIIQIGDLVKTTQIQTTQVATMVGQYGAVLQGVSGDIHTTTAALTGTAKAATATIASAQPVMENASAFVGHLDTETKPVLASAQNLMNDSDQFMTTLPPLTAAYTHVGDNLAATTGDFQTKFHSFLFPPPCHRLGCHMLQVLAVAQDASKFIAPASELKNMVDGQQIYGSVQIVH